MPSATSRGFSTLVRVAMPTALTTAPLHEVGFGGEAHARLDAEHPGDVGRVGRVAQLRHRAGLDLTDPLAGEVEVLADLLERARLTTVETEAQGDDPAARASSSPMSSFSTSAGSSAVAAASNGDAAPRSSTRSPSTASPSSLNGCSSDSGSAAISARLAHLLARSCRARRRARRASPGDRAASRGPTVPDGAGRGCRRRATGRRIVRPVFAMPREIA